jgi:hypothetical protein
MAGSFRADGLVFVEDDGYAEVELAEPVDLYEEAFDGRLVETGRVPDLFGSALASWILARIAHLTDRAFAIEGEIEVCDGGVFVLDFVVQDEGGEARGKVQIQAGTIGAGVLGVLESSLPPERVVRAILSALTSEPTALRACEIRVVDPAAEEKAPLRYGFDGAALLS